MNGIGTRAPPEAAQLPLLTCVWFRVWLLGGRGRPRQGTVDASLVQMMKERAASRAVVGTSPVKAASTLAPAAAQARTLPSSRSRLFPPVLADACVFPLPLVSLDLGTVHSGSESGSVGRAPDHLDSAPSCCCCHSIAHLSGIEWWVWCGSWVRMTTYFGEAFEPM